jgi:hypothetical protein
MESVDRKLNEILKSPREKEPLSLSLTTSKLHTDICMRIATHVSLLCMILVID